MAITPPRAKLRVYVVALATLIAVLGLATPVAARRTTHCRLPHGARLELRTPTFVLWQTTKRLSKRFYPYHTRFVACLRSTGTRSVYGVQDEGGPRPPRFSASLLRAAGAYFATYTRYFDKYSLGNAELLVYDVARGRYSIDLVVHEFNGDFSDEYYVPQFGVTVRGFLAWREVQPGTPQPYGAIMAHDSEGTRSLDTAGPSDFSRLAIHGETVSWRHGGVAKSSLLR